jgi:hypothetical protein
MQLYGIANLSIHAIWPVSFILVMVTASSLHIQRLMVFYCYLSKVILTCAESLWWRGIWRTTERQAWSEDFGSNSPTALRHYDILNRNPSLLIGLRRALLMVGLMIIFVTVGFTHADAKWARWAGVMLAIELALKLVLHVAWLRLPEKALGRTLREQMRERWPRWRGKLKALRGAHVNQETERVPLSRIVGH